VKVLDKSLKWFFRKPLTREYPFEESPAPEGYRGKHRRDKKKCTYCGVCARNCPTGAIRVDSVKKKYSLDLGKCIFCGRCEEACPFDAIHLTRDYAMASKKRRELFIK